MASDAASEPRRVPAPLRERGPAPRPAKDAPVSSVTDAEWARARGYNVRTVYAVIRGDLAASRGVTHRIAIELGLKEPVSNPKFVQTEGRTA